MLPSGCHTHRGDPVPGWCAHTRLGAGAARSSVDRCLPGPSSMLTSTRHVLTSPGTFPTQGYKLNCPSCSNASKRLGRAFLCGTALPYLFAERSPPCALGLLVALGQGSVAGAQPLAGGIVNLHGNPLSSPFLGICLHVNRLLIAQKVFEPSKQFWEFPKIKGIK